MDESNEYDFGPETEQKSIDEGEEKENVDLSEYPVGQSPDAISSAVEQGFEQGALSEILSGYSPEQFNDLIDNLAKEYKDVQSRKIKYRISVMVLSIVLVLFLFGGLAWITITLNLDGGALVFFAGTLAGYFMRLASELT